MLRKAEVSKFLSFILRHAALKYNLELDECEFTNLYKVLSILKEKFSLSEKKRSRRNCKK
ncbi:MAG TPA: hypothetical protein EYP89_00550 [Candidatus Omnitrophica bacterium]|nr:hypothetical protein [Candidatus Omnitrophota bacterium]